MKYDVLIAGAGLYGSTLANQLNKAGKECLVIDKRPHIAGNAYTECQDNIHVQVYGAHIFHTKHKVVWDFVNKYAEFNRYRHSVRAIYDDKVYSLPVNMNTFYQFWGCKTPACAKECLAATIEKKENVNNFEDWAISQIGWEIYDALFYGYTKKQWFKEPLTLPIGIFKRLPVRFTWNDNYFSDPYEGIPKEGYTKMVEKMLEGIEVQLNTDFFSIPDWKKIAKKLVFTGPIDQFFQYKYGPLEYLSLRFEHQRLKGDFQGISVMNYCDPKVPYTRIIEHKHFYFQEQDSTVITTEYPVKWQQGAEPYYPVITEDNQQLYLKYKAEVEQDPDIIMGGRLGTFSYLNMDQVILLALEAAKLLV